AEHHASTTSPWSATISLRSTSDRVSSGSSRATTSAAAATSADSAPSPRLPMRQRARIASSSPGASASDAVKGESASWSEGGIIASLGVYPRQPRSGNEWPFGSKSRRRQRHRGERSGLALANFQYEACMILGLMRARTLAQFRRWLQSSER